MVADIQIWLDDEQPMPEGYTHHIKTAWKCIELLKSGYVTKISFDHDLGPFEAGNGYEVAKWIEEQSFLGNFNPKTCSFKVHTQNPIGRKNICQALQSAILNHKDN